MIKKLLCIILSAVMVLMASSIVGFAAPSIEVDKNMPSNASYVAGDADGDAVVNAADALKVINHSTGEYKITDVVRLSAADVNADKKVNSTDALKILNYKVGNINGFERENLNISSIAGAINYDPYTGCVIDDQGLGLVGYAYDASTGVFYSTGQGWQRTVGYTELYDRAAVFAAMPLDTSRIYFSYGDYDWMVQLWKGYYGYIFEGCEIGLYNREKGSSNSYYNCVTEEFNQQMSMHYTYGLRSFTRSANTWWLTGFILPSTIVRIPWASTVFIPNMKVEFTITFTDSGLCNAFVEGLKNTEKDAIFANYNGRYRDFKWKEGDNLKVTSKTNTVWFSWQ